MSADWINIHVRYKQNGADEEWTWKRLRVAHYLNLCCRHDWAAPERLFNALKPDEFYRRNQVPLLEKLEYLNRNNRNKQFEEYEDPDVGGNFEKIRENIVNGLRKYFPEVLFEVHCIVQWGDILDTFWIYDGDQLYKKFYNIESVESEMVSFEDQFSEETLNRIATFLINWQFPTDLDEDAEEEWNNWWPEKYVPPDPTESDPYPTPETYVIDSFYDGMPYICYWYLVD